MGKGLMYSICVVSAGLERELVYSSQRGGAMAASPNAG